MNSDIGVKGRLLGSLVLEQPAKFSFYEYRGNSYIVYTIQHKLDWGIAIGKLKNNCIEIHNEFKYGVNVNDFKAVRTTKNKWGYYILYSEYGTRYALLHDRKKNRLIPLFESPKLCIWVSPLCGHYQHRDTLLSVNIIKVRYGITHITVQIEPEYSSAYIAEDMDYTDIGVVLKIYAKRTKVYYYSKSKRKIIKEI